MNIGILIVLAFFGFIIYYLVFRVPSSDLVFTSNSEAEVNMIQKYLSANGIKTYLKNRDVQRFVLDGALGNPTLHVVDSKDYKKAIDLIQNYNENSK